MTRPIAPGNGNLAPPPFRDVNSLTGPTTPNKRVPVIDKTKIDPQLLKAAQGMETLFLNQLMKAMRDSVPKNESDLESSATEVYRGMFDTEVSERAAKAGGVGLADQIIAYLQGTGYNNSKVVMPSGPSQSVKVQSRTGGTNED